MPKFLYRFLAGFFMGVAEITPGISGATIAGIFNVYRGFIAFLNSINPIKLNLGIKIFFKEIDVNFITPLLVGMSISIYLSAFAIDYLMNSYLFFFKLFLSLVMVVAVIKNCFFDQSFKKSTGYLLTFATGIFIATIISMSIIQLDFNNFFLLLISGLLAFTAFLLPGISGSLVMVILGVYESIIVSIKDLDFYSLIPFILGIGLSFLIVPKQILNQIKQNEIQTKVFFSGLIFGSVPAVWVHLN
jgi:putative membrane protein